MKTIPQPDLYQCETCGATYHIKANAELCEETPVEQPIFSIGDRVSVRSPYAGSVETVIEEISAGPIPDSFIRMCDSDNRIARGYATTRHSLQYRVSRDIEVSKDGETSRVFYAAYLEKVKL